MSLKPKSTDDTTLADLPALAVGKGSLVPKLTRDELPAAIKNAGDASAFAYEEFLFGHVRNKHTRRAYTHAVNRFLDWIQKRKIALHQVTPKNVGDYFESLELSIPSKKLHRAGLNHFFDLQVKRHAVVLNPVSSVRNERYEVHEGKTQEITLKQARKLFASVSAENLINLRDRAILAVLAYSGSRIGAVARLRAKDLTNEGDQWVLAFNDKGGKHRKVPVRHDLQKVLLDYMNAAGIVPGEGTEPIFRTAVPKKQQLTTRGMTDNDMQRMFKRRIIAAGLPGALTPHSFRVTTITTLLEQGVALEDVQNLANHSDPRTTLLYDRRKRKITRNIVERIPVYADVEE
jgi:integrase/recombinase XerD